MKSQGESRSKPFLDRCDGFESMISPPGNVKNFVRDPAAVSRPKMEAE